MEIISRFVFLPLAIALLAVAFNETLRRKALSVSAIAGLEKKLSGLERFYWPAFALIMAAGMFVRCWRFVELPLGINQDGLMAGTEAFSLLMNGTDQYGTSLPTYFEAWGFSQMSTLYSFLMIPFIKVLGLSKLTLRLPMLLVSLAMLPLIWDFARRMAGRGFALAALLVAALNPWHILQSRWALEANLMPHVLLAAVYLLYLGRERRWALYLSMVLFALTPYAYGVACFVTPVILVLAAAYYLARGKVSVVDVVICVAIFLCLGGPYFYTMAVNAFGLETAHLGPITMPYFEESLRANDMAFSQTDPYLTMVRNFFDHLDTWTAGVVYEDYNVLPWTGALYLFMPPVALWGACRLWKDRRRAAARAECDALRDGGMLLLIWMGAAVFCGAMIGGIVNRNNAVFYPLIFLSAYALVQMGKRLKAALAAMLAVLLISFMGLSVMYFTDESYREGVGEYFRDGLYDALVDTWGWDYDQYYVHTTGEADGAHARLMNAYVMFAHQIDYRGRNEDVLLRGPDGQEIDWYYGERYVFEDMSDFEPDPMACAVYIIPKEEKEQFNADEYLITDYGNYAAVYPRYWAE